MAKSQKNQTIDLSRIDLGELDAGLDVNFLEYAITLPILKSLEGRTTSIIVGPKGSGKTGIRLKFAAGMPQHRTIKVSEEESMDFHDLSTSNPNEMRKKIEAYIIGLVYHWLSSHDNYDVSEFKTFADTPLFGFFKTLTKSTKVAPLPFITIALSDLFPPDKKTSVSYLLSSGFTDKLRRAIGTETLWILIDDIDAFVSTEQGAQRRVVLEQLLYAVSDLNLRSLKNSVWVVAFMKSEIFKEVRKVATEVDKAREYIEHISWSPDNLRAAVQERIEWEYQTAGT